jgi:hypothetical protein
MTAYPALVAAASTSTADAAANYSNPSSAAGGNSAAGSDGVAAEVSRWLLRAALLEDELQGRALEVRDALQQATERREQLEALLLSMAGCRGPHRTAAAASHLDDTW